MDSHATFALRVLGLSKVFEGRQILQNLSFSVQEGECLAMVGPSGSGKSVLFKILNRLVDPSAGLIELFGTDISTIDPVALRRRVCLVGQLPTLFEGTVTQNLEYPFSFKNNLSLKKPDFSSLLELVGLAPSFLARDAQKLSGGEQQRVCIARALALNPDVLLLDEPTSALDQKSVNVVETAIYQINKLEGRTILMATHDLALAKRLGERTLNLVEGRIEGITNKESENAVYSV